MINPLRMLFEFTDTLQFETTSNIDDAVSRLAHSISKTPLQASLTNKTSETTLVGSVSREHVKLHRVAFMYGNIFKPVFQGNFRSSDGKVRLVGSFKMARTGKVSTEIALAVSCLAQVISLPLMGTKNGLDNIFFFFPIGFASTAVIVALFGKRSGKSDIDWIQKRIEKALR